MLNQRSIVWLIPLLLLLSFPLWRPPLASFLQPRGGFNPQFRQQDQTTHNFAMERVIIVQNQAGKTTAEIRAAQAQTSEIPNEFILTSVDSVLYDEQNQPVNVIADTGIYNTQTRQLTLIERVRVDRVASNQQLFSDLLYYYDETRTITSPGAVRLVGEHIEIKGESLDYDIAANQYLIGGRVYCTIAGAPGP